MNQTQRKTTERALRKIRKCGGDCKKCEHCLVPATSNYYTFLCGIADKAGYVPYSNTIKDLHNRTIECLEFELK